VTPVKYEDFLPHVLPFVPNCLDEQAIIAVRSAAIDFCEESLVLQQDLREFEVYEGEAKYKLYAPADYLPHFVLGLYYDGRELPRLSQVALDQQTGSNWRQAVGTPRTFTQFDPDSVVLFPCPGANDYGTISGRLAIVPKRTSTTVDALLFDRHLDAIVRGAVARLMATPNQPYTDLKSSQTYSQMFRMAALKARLSVQQGYSRAPMRARPRNF
jgi:hypothetical protein